MPKVFRRDYCEILLESFGWNKKKGKGGDAGIAGISLKQLRGMLSPFILRRQKKDVLSQMVVKTGE